LLPTRPPISTLFPYTTLFRSTDGKGLALLTWNSRSADNKWCGGMGLTMELFDSKGAKTIRQLPGDTLITKAAPEAILVEIYRPEDRKSTRLNSSHVKISYAVF